MESVMRRAGRGTVRQHGTRPARQSAGICEVPTMARISINAPNSAVEVEAARKVAPRSGVGPRHQPKKHQAHQSTWRGRERVDRVIGPAIDLSGVWSGEKVRSSPFKARLEIFLWSLAGGSLRKTVGPLVFLVPSHGCFQLVDLAAALKSG
jgi:hypothetical protein